eukprot:4442022-Pyramimonas_sp.AAC.1
MFLEEGVGLDERGQQLMRVMMKTRDSYSEALAAIREMDVTRREHLSFQKRSFMADSSFPKDEPTYS